MPTDATGTPTALGIPTFNVDVDAPSGLGFNEAMAQIDALIQLRAPIAGPTFTGTVIAPTPAAGDNSTKVATTAYIENRLGVVVGTNTAAVATAATTFGTGSDLLTSDLSFTALAGASYEVVVTSSGRSTNNVGGGEGIVKLKLDGADGGLIGLTDGSVGSAFYGRCIISPAAGAHTVNARLVASSGNTTQFNINSGGLTSSTVITIRRIS